MKPTRPRKLLLLWLLASFAAAHAHQERAQSCEERLRTFYGHLIAEPPTDPMGAEFQNIFGRYLAEHHAERDNLEPMAREIFLLRLRLAQKYGTQFAQMMEPVDPEGQPIRNWLKRWNGQEVEPRYSFGIEGHPRADVIWARLKETLNLRNAHAVHLNPNLLKLFRFWSPDIQPTAARWEFPYRVENLIYTFSLYQLSNGAYFMIHASDQDIPSLRQRAQNLWKQARSAPTLDSRVQALAEFEWLWYWTNPFGRSGALTGDALSLLMQKAWAAEHLEFKMRKEYVPADLAALSRPLDEYLTLRRAQLLSRDK